MLVITELVKKIIGKDTKKARKGSLLHDGQLKFGIHFVDIFAYWIGIRLIGTTWGKKNYKDKIILTLLTCSPSGNNNSEEDEGVIMIKILILFL